MMLLLPRYAHVTKESSPLRKTNFSLSSTKLHFVIRSRASKCRCSICKLPRVHIWIARRPYLRDKAQRHDSSSESVVRPIAIVTQGIIPLRSIWVAPVRTTSKLTLRIRSSVLLLTRTCSSAILVAFRVACQTAAAANERRHVLCTSNPVSTISRRVASLWANRNTVPIRSPILLRRLRRSGNNPRLLSKLARRNARNCIRGTAAHLSAAVVAQHGRTRAKPWKRLCKVERSHS